MANWNPIYKVAETLNSVNGSFGNCAFNIGTIVVVKRGAAFHPRSSKANQGRPNKRKGCPCSNPRNCLRVMFFLLGGYQLSQSAMVSHAFLPHPSSSCKYKRERAMLNIWHSPRVQSLVVFMDAIDLLWLLVPVRGDPRSHAPECPILPLQCSIGLSTELFFSDVLENWLDLDIATHRSQNIVLEVSQLFMALDYKALTFTNHCVVYCEVFSTCTYWWNVIERPIITLLNSIVILSLTEVETLLFIEGEELWATQRSLFLALVLELAWSSVEQFASDSLQFLKVLWATNSPE